MKTIRLTPGELEELIQFLEDPDEPLCTLKHAHTKGVAASRSP